MTDPKIKKGKGGRIECTVTCTQEDLAPAEEKALHELSRDIEIEGFRKGSAPMEMMKKKVDAQKLLEKAIHNMLPTLFERLMKEHDIKPVIHPNVAVESKDPLVLTIVFIEKPDVKLKGVDKIKIEKKEPKIEEKELQKMIDYVLEKHKAYTAVEREAKKSDRITMDFYGEDSDGKEIEGIRTEGHQVEIGSKVLIPGFEDALIGTKKGEKKSFTLTFPEKYHAEKLQNAPVTFHVTIQNIEEVSAPTLTDAFVKEQLGASSVEEFKQQIEESMMMQERSMEDQRRERKLMEELTKCVTVELADELIDEETRQMVREFEQQLSQQSMSIEQWMQQTNKKPEEFVSEMKTQAKERLTLRLGIQKLVEEREIDVSDDEMETIVEEFLSRATPEQRKEAEPAYKKGAQAYEQLKWQTKVDKILKTLLS